MTNKLNIPELRRLHAAATQGDWHVDMGEDQDWWKVFGPSGVVFDDGSAAGEYSIECSDADRDAIIAAHNSFTALLDAAEECDAIEAKLAALVAFNEKLLGRERKEVYPDCDFCRDSGHGHECPGPIPNTRWAELYDAIAAAKEP